MGGTIGAIAGGIKTGTWDGALKGLINGAIEGAASGFMVGAFTGAFTGALKNTKNVLEASKHWDKGTYKNSYKSMSDHYKRKVVNQGLTKGNNVVKYTNDAKTFMLNNGNSFSLVRGGKGLQHTWTLGKSFGSGVNGLYTSSGKIITFSYWY